MSNPLLCPACKTELVPGTPECYQTLDEHVCCPNNISPIRATVVCPNPECQAHQHKVFWAADGEGPYRDQLRHKYPWIDNNPCPFNSSERASYFAIHYHDEDRRFRIGKKLVIRREVHYRSDDYGHKKGKRVRYSFWKNNVLWTPGIRMLLFSLRQFYRYRKLRKSYVISEIKGMEQRSKWPQAEWWRKVSIWWVKTFHRKLYKQALETNVRI